MLRKLHEKSISPVTLKQVKSCDFLFLLFIIRRCVQLSLCLLIACRLLYAILLNRRRPNYMPRTK